MWWGIWLGCGTFVPWVEPTSAELTRITVLGTELTGETALPESGLELTAELDVHNPWWSPFTVDQVAWSFTVGDVVLTAGELQEAVFVRPNGITRVDLPIRFTFADFAAATRALAADEVPYTLAIDVHATTAGGPWHWPVVIEGAVPRVEEPEVSFVDWKAGVSGGTLEVDVAVDLGLPERFTMRRGRWRLSVDDHRLGEGRVLDFDPKDSVLHLPFVVDASGSAAAGWSWMQGQQRSLRFDLEGEVVTPAGIVPFEVHRAFAVGGTEE